MNLTILVAEDSPELREVICDYLTSREDTAVPAEDGIRALELSRSRDFDAVLLDIMMPGLDGFTACRAIREKGDVPVIFLTALSDEEDKLYGYELGADDYVTKPFSLSVLYAKITALIRRRNAALAAGDRLSDGDVVLDRSARRVFVQGKEIFPTPREFALLECLMLNRGLVLSREQLLIKCWGYDFEGEARAVDTQIRRLREKLGPAAERIRTVIKAGYRWEAGQ